MASRAVTKLHRSVIFTAATKKCILKSLNPPPPQTLSEPFVFFHRHTPTLQHPLFPSSQQRSPALLALTPTGAHAQCHIYKRIPGSETSQSAMLHHP